MTASKKMQENREKNYYSHITRIVSLSTRKEANVHCVLNTGNVAEPPGEWHRGEPHLLADPWFILLSSILPNGAKHSSWFLYVHLNNNRATLYSSVVDRRTNLNILCGKNKNPYMCIYEKKFILLHVNHNIAVSF